MPEECLAGLYAWQEVGYANLDPLPPGDLMIYLDGSKESFRCDNDCRCHVFRWVDTPRGRRLRCNACGALYVSE